MYYDVKLKKPARRNEESDQRVNQIVQARLLYYYHTEQQYYCCTTVENSYLGMVRLEIPA